MRSESLDVWHGFRFEPDEVSGLGDCVLMQVRLSGTGRASGVEATASLFQLWTIRDGMPHRLFVRATREEALEAAGIRG